MSRITDIADAIAADLNAETFSVDFTAVRTCLPSFDLTDLADLQVCVVPVAKSSTRASRGSWEDGHEIHVGVQQKLTNVTNAVIDPLMELVEEIEDFLRASKFGSGAAICEKVDIVPVVNLLALRDNRVFQSVLALELKGWR